MKPDKMFIEQMALFLEQNKNSQEDCLELIRHAEKEIEIFKKRISLEKRQLISFKKSYLIAQKRLSNYLKEFKK